MIGNIIHRSVTCLASRSKLKLLRLSQRSVSNTIGSDSAAYDGDGKTTVKNLNYEEFDLNLINTYSNGGFRLSNQLFIVGSLVVFPVHGVYSWSVKSGAEITPDSLAVFDIITPKIKILVIGYGDEHAPVDTKIPLYLKKKGISCELLPTKHAVTTYNYLAVDSIPVAGAFIPVRRIVQTDQRDIDASVRLDEETTIDKRLAGYSRYPMMEQVKHMRDAERDIDKKKFDS